jgi:hypothetical protein
MLPDHRTIETEINAILDPWLLPLVDHCDWGYTGFDGTRYALTDGQLADRRSGRWPGFKPQEIGSSLIGSHLRENDTLHYTSARGSGYALLCLDIDAHHGQDDALDAIELLAAKFRGLYFEFSTHYRGFHGYLRVYVGPRRREWFNGLARRFEHAARAYLWEHNIASTIEIKGTFTTYVDLATDRVVKRRGALAKLPRPRRVDAARRLVTSPTFSVAELEGFINEWDPADRPEFRAAHTTRPSPSSSLNAIATARENGVDASQNAFERMLQARLAFAHANGRDPYDADELCDFYRNHWSAEESHEARRRRAQWCLDNSDFDPAELHGGYSRQREQLSRAVRQWVKQEHHQSLPYKYSINHDDLTVVLWVVTSASFEITDDRRRQFGCPTKRIAAAFTKLSAEGVIDRGGVRRDKIKSALLILRAAGLVQCLDDRYCFRRSDPTYGCGKKYVVGPTHWRRQEWERTFPDAANGFRSAA